MRHARSIGVVMGPDVAGGQGEIGFESCCHCGRVHPITMQTLGLLAQGVAVLDYCARCNALRCPACVACVPLERQLENIEAGRDPLDVSRVLVAIPRAV